MEARVTDPREIAAKLTKAQRAAKICIHADPRCNDDPCPYGIWRVLCDPKRRPSAALQEGA